MTPTKQVSPAIRILRGERDASARATHLEAATRKFLVTTNERKQMSTKTNFKRIALVAVAALGLGVLSSVPSQAAISGFTVTVTQDGTSSFALSDSTTAAKINISGIMDTNDSYTIQVVQTSVPAGSATTKLYAYNLDSSTPTMAMAAATNRTHVDTAVATTSAQAAGAAGGDNKNRLGLAGVNLDGTMAYVNDSSAVVVASNPNWVRVTAKNAAATNYSQNFGFQLDSAVARTAGTYTYQVIVKAYQLNPGDVAFSTKAPDQTISKTINIVVAAAASASTTPTATYGFAFISNTSTTRNDGIATRADSALSVVATAGSASVGYIYVGNRNASNISDVAKDSLTATVTGVGTVCVSGGATCGTNITVAATGDYEFELRPNGVGGVSTIMVTAKLTGASYIKTINYYAKAANTITATVAAPLLKLSSNAKAVRGVAVDASGLQWSGQAYIVASSAADAAIAGSVTPVACTWSSADARHDCDVTALAVGTAKLKIIDAATVALATATSNEITVTVTNAKIASVKLSFDKATYAPNERARIYVTPLDAAGKEMQAADYTNVFTSTGITVNGAVSYTGTSTNDASFSGAATFTTASIASSTSGAKPGSYLITVYMPSAGGVVSLSATGGSGLAIANQNVAVTASATVTDSGAAALAAVTALATTVASLKTLITTLTNLVLKIQKKVKA